MYEVAIAEGNSRKRQARFPEVMTTPNTSIIIDGLTDGTTYRITVVPISATDVRGVQLVFEVVVNATSPGAPPTVQVPPDDRQPSTINVTLPEPSRYGTHIL